MTLPPLISLVLPGISVFCGMPHSAETTPLPLEPPELLLLPLLQAVAARAMEIAPTTNLARVAPRI